MTRIEVLRKASEILLQRGLSDGMGDEESDGPICTVQAIHVAAGGDYRLYCEAYELMRRRLPPLGWWSDNVARSYGPEKGAVLVARQIESTIQLGA